jgi:hypothetical protein
VRLLHIFPILATIFAVVYRLLVRESLKLPVVGKLHIFTGAISTLPLFIYCYCILYSLFFFRLVHKNFDLVSKDRVFSRMILTSDLPTVNQYIEISLNCLA